MFNYLRRNVMAQGYLAQVQALIAQRMKENPEEMKRKLKEIERAKKAPKEPTAPPKPQIDPQLTQELIEEMSKDEPDIQKVKDLIKRGADIKAKNKYDATVLHWASYFGDVEFAKECLQAGIDVDAKNDFDKTPLHKAVIGGNVALAKLLISFGADVNVKDKGGITPLGLTVIIDKEFFVYKSNEEMKALLIEHGAK